MEGLARRSFSNQRLSKVLNPAEHIVLADERTYNDTAFFVQTKEGFFYRQNKVAPNQQKIVRIFRLWNVKRREGFNR